MTKMSRCVNKSMLTVLLVVLAAGLWGFGAVQNESCGYERNRYLLLDSRIVANAENAELTIGTVKKHPANPLFGEDKPWEMRFDNLYANVIYDEQEKIYKCWYSPFIIDVSSKDVTIQQRKEIEYRPSLREMAICYATSKDGINWVKPELGVVEFEGSKANNILWRGTPRTGSEKGDAGTWAGPHGSGIFKDLRESDPNRRYKALIKYEILSVAFSPDGIHWDEAIACPEADSAGDTHNNAFWAPTLGKYVGITREWGEPFGRQVARTTSEDFTNWEKCEIVLEGIDPRYQTYSMPVFYHGGIYLGLVAIHDQEDDLVWTELTWSPDTIKWNRVLPGTPFIGNDGKEGDYDWGCVYAAACPVFLEDEIRLYYGGSDGHHNIWRNGFFCLATLRPDGFAGYTQTESNKPATITTTPIANSNGALRLSADVGRKGYVKVRVLDDSNKLLAESEPLNGSFSDKKVTWRDGFSLEKLGNKPVKIQFEFKDTTIYSFSFAE
ncbi:MAG: hypothetical protein ACYSOK_04855 [Planctomycetota bacterium]